ncbi:hypothetical protein ACOMHN_064173 [Nucella lapillus]
MCKSSVADNAERANGDEKTRLSQPGPTRFMIDYPPNNRQAEACPRHAFNTRAVSLSFLRLASCRGYWTDHDPPPTELSRTSDG